MPRSKRVRWVWAIPIAGLVLALGGPEGTATSATGTAGRPGATGPPSPYAGTPADGFAEGAAGIVLPPAEAIPDGHLVDHRLNTRAITATEVATALGHVREAVVATRISHLMLVKHDPEPYIRTMAPSYWETWADPGWWGRRAREFYESPEFADLATKLAPGARLAGPPRVAGRMAYQSATTVSGGPRGLDPPYSVLKIVTQFVWVYAFEATAGIVVIRDRVNWHVPADYRLSCCEVNLGLHHGEAEARAWGADCDAYQEGLVLPDGGPEIKDAVFDIDLEPSGGCPPG